MGFPLTTKRERALAAALLAAWVFLFLPNLRTNPNWYGDEGEWMEKSWTFIHGAPRVGPISNDFVFPYPYPPLYMAVNGLLLRVFGHDLVVSRALGAVTALAAAGVLFWIGTRLRDKVFGFMCAGVFLVYPQTVMNFRWNESPVRVLQNTKMLGRPVPTQGAEAGSSMAPPLVAADFNFASVSDAV